MKLLYRLIHAVLYTLYRFFEETSVWYLLESAVGDGCLVAELEEPGCQYMLLYKTRDQAEAVNDLVMSGLYRPVAVTLRKARALAKTAIGPIPGIAVNVRTRAYGVVTRIIQGGELGQGTDHRYRA